MIEKALMSQPGPNRQTGVSQAKEGKKGIQVHRPPCTKTERERREGDAFREHEVQFGRT